MNILVSSSINPSRETRPVCGPRLKLSVGGATVNRAPCRTLTVIQIKYLDFQYPLLLCECYYTIVRWEWLSLRARV